MINNCGSLVLYSTGSCDFVSRARTSGHATQVQERIFHVDGTNWASLDILFFAHEVLSSLVWLVFAED
jgi:hypothetical protein